MYTEPEWGVATLKSGSFEVLKEGRIIQSIPISVGTRCLSFGRLPDNDITLDHDSISRNHAILQFGPRNSAFVYDLGSTHGTFLNKKRLPSDQYVKITSGNNMIQFGASTRIYLLNLEETPPEESNMQLETKFVSFGKCILSFFEAHDIPINVLQFFQKGNTVSCSLNFSDFLSIDSSEPSRITSSGITKKEALDNFYEDAFNFLSRLNLIEKQGIVSDSETENYDEEFLNERMGIAYSPKGALSEKQLLSLKSQLKSELEFTKSQLENVSTTLETLEKEIVEDFDVYVQDLRKAELKNDIEKFQFKLESTQKVIHTCCIQLVSIFYLLGIQQI